MILIIDYAVNNIKESNSKLILGTMFCNLMDTCGYLGMAEKIIWIFNSTFTPSY